MSSRSGSNNRKMNGVVSFRMEGAHRKALDLRAQKLGFKNANELARHRVEADLESALAELSEGSDPFAAAS